MSEDKKDSGNPDQQLAETIGYESAASRTEHIGPYQILELLGEAAWAWYTWLSSRSRCGGVWR